MYDYPALAQVCPVIAFDREHMLFYLDDKTIGFGFECTPLGFFNQELQSQITSLLSLEFPDGTSMSFYQFRSPDIDEQLDSMINLRFGFNDPLLSPMLIDRADYLREHTEHPIMAHTPSGDSINCGRIVDVKLMITVKIPVGNGLAPTQAEVDTATDLRRRTLSALRDCGFQPIELTASRWLRFMGTIVNWGDSASWKRNVLKSDPTAPLNEQFYDMDSDIDDTDMSRSFIGIKRLAEPKFGDPENDHECFAQVLSPKTFPEAMYFGSAMSFMGDTMGRARQAGGNYAICCTLLFINHTAAFDRIRSKRSITSRAAFAPVLLRARPELGDAIGDFDTIYNSVKDGGRLIRMAWELVVFSPTRQQLIAESQELIQYFSKMDLKLMVDRYIQQEMFFNTMPFCVDTKFLFGGESKRYLTLTNTIALVLLPIFSEWKGTGTGHVALISRTGQLMTLSLHDAHTNKNALIAAESGSGKSFFTNELLSMYMSEGARVWIIDIGRSYQKLCNILGGDFISFNPEDLPGLNPFKMISDINEEHDSIIAILKNMIAPHGDLNSAQEATLIRIFDELWASKKTEMTIDDVRDELLKTARETNDQRVHDMATQLYMFTSDGQYGKVFNSENTVNFSNRFTVLELEELNAFPHLRQVVLLQLILQIQQAIFLNPDRKQKKIVMIDEAWDLLKSGQTAVFMEHAYRKFRKYGASAIIATQSLNDLYSNAEGGTGKAIAENSAFYFLLGQKPETVESVKKEGYLDLSEGGFEILKTVHTIAGAFSELFIKSEVGTGIGRLIVSEFEKLMFSTDARDIAALQRYVSMGVPYSLAIKRVMIDRGLADTSILDIKHDNFDGKPMSEEESKRENQPHHQIRTDAEVRFLLSGEYDSESGQIVLPDGSNIRNPARGDERIATRREPQQGTAGQMEAASL